MCGVTGFWDFSQSKAPAELLALAQVMALEMEHRGPDGLGVWCDEKFGVALGHRRLAIVDLSEAGYQPMISHSKRSVLAYNGEVYNAPELRKELIAQGCQFRGYSDTEVILEACEAWGVEATCQRLIGMFAFAFWDQQEKTLFLVRDRLGIKPLYWGIQNGVLLFGSELKSLIKHPAFNRDLNKEALAAYFRFNYVPTPLSIFQGISKLPAATILTIQGKNNIQEKRFWDFPTIVQQGIENTNLINDVAYIEELDKLLRDAVKRRMVADVPLGAFLSGGIDSSTVVALMQAQSDRPIKTFSIGFHEEGYNEATYAALVAKHLKTEHHELYLSAADAQGIIPDIPKWFDEPFADVSQVPTFLVSKMARTQVTVSLSGDGGDELFAGYHRYLRGYAIWQWVKWMPFYLRKALARAIHSIDPLSWERVIGIFSSKWQAQAGDRLYKLADVMTMPDSEHFYRSLVSFWQPSEIVLGASVDFNDKVYPWETAKSLSFRNFIEKMQFWDTATYLPDDILTKVDRASMAVSLEARVPLLDHRVVEYSWRLPFRMKVRNGQGKWILRQVLNRYLPEHLIDRPKMGFGVPIDRWLRGSLREWAEDLLSRDRLEAQGLLNPEIIHQRWQEHLSGRRNWQYALWGVLMFQAWHAKWLNA